MSTIFTDIECYHGFFYVGFKRQEDGKRVGVEYSSRQPVYDRAYVRNVLLRHTTIGFNSLSYDLPMLWYSLEDDVTNEKLKAASDRIIKGRVPWWEVEDLLGIRIPFDLKKRHIDLIEPQPNAFASLKALNGRMHGKQLQDLPFDPDLWLTPEQMEIVGNYCLHSDLDATENLFNALKEPLDLRRALGPLYDQNFMCKSDAQIGEMIVKSRVEKLSGSRAEKAGVKAGTQFRYPIPDFMKFETPELQAILDKLRETDFTITDDGKVDMPKWLSDTAITIGDTTYQMGIGGLHSTESNRAVHSSETHVLVDADVASQYPAIILMLGLYPKALGKHFLDVYREIKGERLKAKKRAKAIKIELKEVNDPDRKVALEAELEACKVKDKGFKIALNGVYGKLGSRYSVLYAPHLLISVTLTGQLTLLMLIERAERAGISVVSGNTDGVMFLCPRKHYAGLDGDRLKPSRLADICQQWETDTTLDLEFGEYRSLYNQSVNSYFTIKADGGHKRKGPLGNPWSEHPDDFDPVRGQLMKNPQATICSDAALAMIKDGTPVEVTIRSCHDIKQFVTVIKSDGGATWRDEYLGKVVRYYWSTDGAPIFKAKPHPSTGNFPKVPKTDGAAPCMRLPDEFPDDIDYEKYMSEAEEILSDLGFYGPKVEPRKPLRITKANRFIFYALWSTAP
ncbi:DNA polymerase domain-containing protein [Mesorhizobium sp. INR15]|uniref:DNA polymerase domain-containing protein n=1 Tax=Mesorhizobium sp. INR15 TaxID=2654248 RepID=UPI00189662B3|nr:DNA polymerase domain-containing protein [Mesorhizobium sp. INR15]